MLEPIQEAPADHWPPNRASQQSQIAPSLNLVIDWDQAKKQNMNVLTDQQLAASR